MSQVIMICVPVSRLRLPPVPSRRERCGECGAYVWVDERATHDGCICLDCAVLNRLQPSGEMHPQVRETLLLAGYSEEQCDWMQEQAKKFLKVRKVN